MDGIIARRYDNQRLAPVNCQAMLGGTSYCCRCVVIALDLARNDRSNRS